MVDAARDVLDILPEIETRLGNLTFYPIYSTAEIMRKTPDTSPVRKFIDPFLGGLMSSLCYHLGNT